MITPTTGNWVFDGKENPAITVEGDMGWPIVSVVHGPTLREADWNGRIIAAAPEMLKACRAVLEWAKTPGDHGGNPYSKEFVALAHDAIKKVDSWAPSSRQGS